MAVTPTPIFPQSILSSFTQYTSSTSATSLSTATSILSAQTNGAKVESILVTSTNSAAVDVNLCINVSSTNYNLGTISIPATAGTVDTIPAVNLFTATSSGTPLLPLPLDANGNPYLYLSSATALTVYLSAAPASGKVINVLVTGGAF